MVSDGHRLGWAVTVLGQNQVGLTAARVVTLEGIRAVQQDHHITILFQRIMNRNPLCYKVIRLKYCPVVDILLGQIDEVLLADRCSIPVAVSSPPSVHRPLKADVTLCLRQAQ